VLIKTDDTGPNFISKCDSNTVQTAFLSGFAFNSNISEASKISSKSSSTHSQVFAETQTIETSHHQSSEITQCCDNPDFTLSRFAPGLSILVIATIICIQASRAWLILSIVCGLTHSSAATTKIAISVDLAHLALIIVKASCHGVSKNVIFLPLYSTWYAQIL
jgi:hypothetical protein